MVEATPEHVPEIDALLRRHIKSQTLTDEAFEYMSNLIIEDCPRNTAELFELIKDFLKDGFAYTNDDEGFKVCDLLQKIFLEKKLISVMQRDTIVAEKLANSVQLGEMSLNSKALRDEDFIDPFIGMETQQSNYNSQFDKGKLAQATAKARAKEADALDKKIAEFMEHKQKIPPPEVRHDGKNNFRADIMIPMVTLIVGGKVLLDQAQLKLVRGKKYGLVGRNGIGKTCLINAISRHEIEKFPQSIHILQVEQEVEADSKTVLDHILDCDVERKRLLEEMDECTNIDDSGFDAEEKAEIGSRLSKAALRLDEIDSASTEAKAIKILAGIGFTQNCLNRPANSFSGGWRMRIAIAKVIFCEPEILMLDEPTNHLDLPALMWLENYIQTLDTTVIIVSHARDFLNMVCDEIIHFQSCKMTYYKGNFDAFERVHNDKMKLQAAQQATQDTKIAGIQKFIDKFRFNAKRSSLVQSRVKAIQRIDLIADVITDPEVIFMFPNAEKISPPLMRLDEAILGYQKGTNILQKVNLSVDLETRIALVGPNGAGKSTLVKALQGELEIFDGYRFIHNRLRIGVFTQHHMDSLDLKMSAVEQMMVKYENVPAEKFRSHLGAFGISGTMALRPMYLLSGGQKSRVSFAVITWEKPHILMLDEPTNHLDFDAINALIVALNNFEGGLVVVSHDEYFLNALCDRLFIVNNKRVEPFEGDLKDYRKLVTKTFK